MKRTIALACLSLSIIYGCKPKESQVNTKKLTIALNAKSGSNVSGTATLIEKNGTVSLDAKIQNIAPGVHAIHLHEKSDCSSADATSTGGHWNPLFKSHGKFGGGSYHAGDIGNFTADDNGNATVSFSTDQWCIGCGDPNKDILGKAIIIHQKPDDFTTQPTGNAGARIACAGIITE